MAITVTTIEKEVAFFLGYGYVTNASGNIGDFLDNIVDRAIRQFVIPPPMEGSTSAHKWSWLTASTNVVLNEPYTASHATSTLATSTHPSCTDGVINFGFTGSGEVPSWAFSSTDKKRLMLNVSGLGDADGWHIPTALTATTATLPDTTITVGAAASGVSFGFYQAFHDVPADFGATDGSMHHDLDKGYSNIPIISIGAMRDLYASKPITSYVPDYAAFDYELSKFMFYPPPNAQYVLRYNYTRSSSQAAGALHPLIPAKYEGVVINGALALAENYADTPNDGRFLQMYTAQLKASVLEDRANLRENFFGVNRDQSDEYYEPGRRTDRAKIYYIDPSGTKYPN